MTIALGKNKTEIELPTRTGNKIATIIRKGVALKERLSKFQNDKAENDAKIIPFAETHTDKTGMKSATFKTADGEVKVVFSDTIKYEKDDVLKMKKIFGPLFSKMFHEVPSFTLNPENVPELREKLGDDFKRLVSEDSTYKHTPEFIKLLSNADSKLGKRIRPLATIEPNKPSVSFNPVAK